ncbi:MAG TPA: hypothetical protein VKY39_01835 [Aggregatilineales bacterium]|nr:hypothetical protein [Aggregatilineales bacterium]
MTPHLREIIATTTAPLRAVTSAVAGAAAPVARRWWNNPLLRHASRLHRFPLAGVRRVLPWLAALLMVLAIAGWVLAESFAGRALGALLTLASLGVMVVLPAAVAPLAAWVASSQAAMVRRDPSLLNDIPPAEFAWGLTLSALWRLRWPLVAALALTPAFVVGVLRLDVVSFTAWSESAETLAGATAASRAVWLLPGGGVPVFRLGMRALSAGLLVWTGLPLLATLGVLAGLLLPEPVLSLLAALLGGTAVAAAVVIAWHYLSLMPFLFGPGEAIRLALLAGLLFGAGHAARGVNDASARLLSSGRIEHIH